MRPWAIMTAIKQSQTEEFHKLFISFPDGAELLKVGGILFCRAGFDFESHTIGTDAVVLFDVYECGRNKIHIRPVWAFNVEMPIGCRR